MFDIGSYFPPAIKTICIACVSVFLAQEVSQLLFGMAGWNFWLAWFGLVPQAVTHGFVWQLFTYIFLHGGIWHILFNLLYLCMFGADLERAWGRAWPGPGGCRASFRLRHGSPQRPRC